MKISVNDVELLTLTETQIKVLQNEIKSEIFDADMKRRVDYIVTHKYAQCFKKLKAEWDPKLAAAGVASVPTDKDAYANLVFSQPDYKDRSAREALVQEPV